MMGLQDFFNWRSQTTQNMPATADEEIPAEVDEPPDNQIPRHQPCATDFAKATIRPEDNRKVSLLTKAFQNTPAANSSKPGLQLATDLVRRRSMMSNASLASTAELTSDGGLTSPARTNTPSPPFPATNLSNFAPYSFTSKTGIPPMMLDQNLESKDASEILTVSPKMNAPPPRKRCITFMCDGKKDMATHAKTLKVPAVIEPAQATMTTCAPKPRKCTIQFACPGPKAIAKEEKKANSQTLKPAEASKRSSRSPSTTRKPPRPVVPASRSFRRASRSPVAVRAKPKYIIADENTIQSSEATRFHEFASEEPQEDDWIRKASDESREKLTINDTLKKENAIRLLGNQAEEEALEEDDDDEDDDEEDDEDLDSESDSDLDSNDDLDLEDGEEPMLLDGEELDEDEGEDVGVSDGNETDNEAGFADSDNESDATGDFAFWTPRGNPGRQNRQPPVARASAHHRAASASSIDSLDYMEPAMRGRRMPIRRPMKIRPGTPDLPDSTDFVCGTLDEDRPLEDAYVSCIKQKKNAKHKQTPQDIDPSFPTSDPEDEEDEEDLVDPVNDSDDHIWIHGKFEESDDDRNGRHRSTAHHKSPVISPRRLHSPPPPKRLHSPPAKLRLRSPPPRKLFTQSPRRMRSPPPARTIRSPLASPTQHSTSQAIAFAPLGARPGLTHTKSLPRSPNAFCRQYRASRLVAANGNNDGNDAEGHVRGALDIVKGL